MSDNGGDILLAPEGFWIRLDGREAVLGLTQDAQNELGDIVRVDMDDAGEEYQAADQFGSIEARNMELELYMPISCAIVERNEELLKSPELINTDPYGDGWIARVKILDRAELDDLLDAGDDEPSTEV